MEDVEVGHDSDPIKASYDVYIKPHISADRQIYILQFPNRDSRQHYSHANKSQPLQMRIKPNAGMVELDVPMDVWHNYDKGKGVTWGEAMKKSNSSKGGGSHGLPGGFGIGGAQPGGRGRNRGIEDREADQQRVLDDYKGAVEREQVLVKQTLGGQSVPNEESTPQYMIGTFRKGQLHLTPVDNIVQMRPQFHHIDAQSEQERAGRGRDPALPARVPKAQAVHMSVKVTIDGEEQSSDTMAKRIAATQEELWKSHKFIDEDTGESWEAYNENLFVAADGGVDVNEELLAKVPKLLSTLNDAEYLDTISAPRDAAKLSRSKKVKDRKGKGKGKEKAVVSEDGNDEDESDTSSTLSDPSITEGEDNLPL